MNNLIFEMNDLKLDNDSLLLCETLFHNANGYLGVRSNFEEGYPSGFRSVRGTYINGFYDFSEMNQAEKLYGLVEEKQTMLNVNDAQGIRLFLGKEEFSMFKGKVLSSKRSLNMQSGVTSREIIWKSPEGKEAEILIIRMASFKRLPLFTIEYSVRLLNCSCEITLISSHNGNVMNYFDPTDPRIAAEAVRHLKVERVEQLNDTSFILSKTSRSKLEVCSGAAHRLPGGRVDSCQNGDSGVETALKINGEIGKPVRLIKYITLTDSLRYADPFSVCKQQLSSSLKIPIEELYKEQEEYLSEIWKRCELKIDGNDDLNLALMYNTFQLIQSVTRDEFGNIAAKGLSGEGYEGHYFWDTEMFIEPFFVLTMPEYCLSLLSMRYKTLDFARENARIMGYSKGALYPWRTIMGKECSGHYPSGTAQVHINGDIAYAIIAYYLATGDLDFIMEMGAEMLFEIARHWIESGNYYQGKFQLNCVTGPDEYTCLVNNNYFTNALAKYSLNWAAKIYDLLVQKGKIAALEQKLAITSAEVDEFRKASEAMTLLYDQQLKINPQDDSFLQKKPLDFASTPKENYPLLLHYHPLHLYRYQVCKQADTIMSHFVLEDYQSLETMRNSFDYYEKITTHDSSLSNCIFAIVAARIGYHEKALKYFGDSAKLDLFDTHHNTKDGIHTANMGGNYMSIVYGFAGLRIKEDGLHLTPFLPQGWQGYHFSVQFHGSRIKVSVGPAQVIIKLAQGEPFSIKIFGKDYLIKEKIEVQY